MDGVMHPSVEQAIGRDRVRNALKRYENRPADEHRYGIVRSVNSDGSYEVLLDGDAQTARCAQFDTALVGDRVIVVVKKDGTNDILGRLGGPIGGGGETIAPTIAERLEKLEVDYIVAEGTSGNWRYWKWASGLAICIYTYSSAPITSCTIVANDIFLSDIIYLTLPFKMIGADASGSFLGTAIWINAWVNKDTEIAFRAEYYTSLSGIGAYPRIFVIGRWK